jgi:excinuclease ABC subunit B
VPQTVKKAVRDVLEATAIAEVKPEYRIDGKKIPKKELKDIISRLENEMRTASKKLAFERAAEIRDLIIELKAQL